MEKLVTASKEELTLCPGLGPLKVRDSTVFLAFNKNLMIIFLSF